MHVIVKFETRYPVGKPPQDWVLLAPQGEEFQRTQTWHRVKTLEPKSDPDNAMAQSLTYQAQVHRWSIVGPAYEAFKKGQDLPEDGTPLAAWAGVNAGQIKALKSMGIATVEAVAEMTEGAVERLTWPDARKLPELATKYLGSIGEVEKDAEMQAMREKMQAMEELLEENMAAKPKRGRPPKESEAA